MVKKRGAKKKTTVWNILFRVVLSISAISLFLAYFSIFINPAKLWFLSLFGLYYIPIVFINVILLVVATVRWSPSAWLPLIVLLPSLFFIQHFIGFNNHSQDNKSAGGYKIMTYNVGQFNSSNQNIPRMECCNHVDAFIRGENPDVVAFQEFYLQNLSEIDRVLPSYPYKHYHLFKIGDRYHFGNLIASKHPIINSGKITFPKSTNLSIYADIKLGKDVVRVYNNHLESYSLSLSSVIKRIREDSDAISEELVSVHKKMRVSNIKRAVQVDSVLNHIRKSPHKAIICGDLNDTPMSYTYQQLKKVSKDTFLEAGRGFSSTYSFLWPLLRIDYILVPQSYDVISHTTPKNRYSDHYPVITKIVKNDERGH